MPFRRKEKGEELHVNSDIYTHITEKKYIWKYKQLSEVCKINSKPYFFVTAS